MTPISVQFRKRRSVFGFPASAGVRFGCADEGFDLAVLRGRLFEDPHERSLQGAASADAGRRRRIRLPAPGSRRWGRSGCCPARRRRGR